VFCRAYAELFQSLSDAIIQTTEKDKETRESFYMQARAMNLMVLKLQHYINEYKAEMEGEQADGNA
jgi:hypothetical protein